MVENFVGDIINGSIPFITVHYTGQKKARNLLEERCLVYSHLPLVSWL